MLKTLNFILSGFRRRNSVSALLASVRLSAHLFILKYKYFFDNKSIFMIFYESSATLYYVTNSASVMIYELVRKKISVFSVWRGRGVWCWVRR